MNARIGLVVVVALASTLASAVMTAEAKQLSSSDAGARRPTRHVISLYRYPISPPRYYARPVYYRPYPYRVPAPFVLGFGPWW